VLFVIACLCSIDLFFKGSSGEATIVVLLAAIVRAAAAAGGSGSPLSDCPSPISGASGARRDVMVVYCSDQTHAIVQKACMVLGVGHLRELATTEKGGWGMPSAALAEAIRADRAAGLVPIACVATCGTTTSCAFDDVASIAEVCRAESIWLHIDAAYGGA
jgi:glutamate/tyrosine decarboxylase-like PLP-dependent enzyme